MKKNFIKRLLSLGLIVCLLSSTGCEILSKSKKVLPVSTDTFQEKRLSEVPLTFYMAGAETSEVKPILNEVEKKLKDSVRMKLNFKWFNKATFTYNIQLALEQNRDFDAMVIPMNKDSNIYNELRKKDVVLDISELLPKVAPKLYDSYTKEDIDSITEDKKIYIIPSKMNSSNRICAVVRDDIMRKFNIPDIKSFTDYEHYLSIVKQNYGDMTPMALCKNTVDLFAENAGYVNLGDYIVYQRNDPSLKLVPWEQTEAFRNAVETLNKWNQYGYIFPVNSSISSPAEFLSQGGVASFLTDWDDAQNEIRILGFNEPKVRIYPLNEDKLSTKTMGTMGIVINKTSKNPERVLKFIESILTNNEVNNLFIYGVKGKNYTLSNDKVKFAENVTKSFGWDGCSAFMNEAYLYNEKDAINNYKKLSDDIKTSSQYSPTATFKINKVEIEGLLNARDKSFKDIQNAITQDKFNYNTDVDSFIQQQEMSGVESAISELQKQISEWKIDKSK